MFDALDLADLSDMKEKVKDWYDGFMFGSKRDIYNPWSITSYDVMLISKNAADNAYVMEFKVRQKGDIIEETAAKALKQIEEKYYDAELISENIYVEQIYHYGFAFDGKNVLIKCKSI